MVAVASLAAPAPARAGGPDESAPVGWATRRAADLTAEAQRLVDAGRLDDALVRLREALGMDATYAPAYLALAAAREGVGDLREAEQVLSMGLERIPLFAEARARRASLRERRGDRHGAAGDLESALAERPADLALHAQVTEAWMRAGETPRALASARRWRFAAAAAGSVESERRATRVAAACAWVVDRADPVTWSDGRDGLRALLARAAAR